MGKNLVIMTQKYDNIDISLYHSAVFLTDISQIILIFCRGGQSL